MRWLVLMMVSFSVGAQEPPSWFTESLLHLPDDVAEAAKERKRVVLYFGQDGCPYCKQLMEVNFRQRAIADKMRRNYVAIALNIWGDREVTWTDGRTISEKRLAAMLKVQFTPTLIVLDDKGAVALRMNGYYPPHRFEQAMFSSSSGADRAANPALNQQPFFLSSNDPRRRGKPLLVLFETPHCAECDELHRVSFARKEVLEQIARFDVLQFTPADAPPWAQGLKVAYVPTLVLLDPRGVEVLRMEAYFRPFHVAGALEYVASGAYRKEPSLQRFLQARAERLRSRGETVDLWN